MCQRARESFTTSAGAKEKPVHGSAMTARKINDKNASMDHHAVPPPEYQAGGHSKRETCVSKSLNDSPRRRQEQHDSS